MYNPLFRTARMLLTAAAFAIAVAVVGASLLPGQELKRATSAELLPLWRQVGDTTLERLTNEALRLNNDVRAARANVRSARLARTLVAFDFAPTVTVNSGFVKRRFSATQLPGIAAVNRDQDVYDAGFDASWEVDLFGRTRSAYNAQRAVAASVDEELRDVQLSLAAEVARTYFELRGAERLLAVGNRNVANQRRTLQITVDRLAVGRGTAFDRERASAQVSTTLASVAATEAQIASATYRLGVLVGGVSHVTPLPAQDADDLEVENTWFVSLPEGPTFESVATLIERRPDVRNAEHRVNAERLQVKSVRQEYLPRLNVTGSVGFNAGATDLLGRRESSRFAIGPVISWPAFNFGRVHTRVEAARARADQTQAVRDQTALAARAEVQSAIVSYDRARTRVNLLRDAASSSERGAGLARLRLDGGESGFLEVLDAQRTLLDSQDRLARAETDAATAFVALYKALGGAWVSGGAPQ